MKEFGEAIRRARLKIGKTLQAVAQDAGVSTSYVGRVERGSLPTPPSEAAIRAMCLAIEIDPSPFLEMRKSFYQMGPTRALRPGSAVEVALNDIAALGEHAFRAAEDQSRLGNIDGAIQLAEIALTHLESSRKHGSVARAAHLLASLYLDRKHQLGTSADDSELRVQALAYYEVSVSAFLRLAMPTADDQHKMYDAIAQSARQFEALSDTTDDSYLPLLLEDFEKWPQLVALASAEVDRHNLLGSLAKRLIDSESADSLGERRSEAQIVSGLMASQLSRGYAAALNSVAEQGNRDLREVLRDSPPSVDNLMITAMVTTNLAGVVIDSARMTSVPLPDEPLKLVSELAVQLRTFMRAAVSSERNRLIRRLQKCHQQLGSWHAIRDEVQEAVWHLFVAHRLDSSDSPQKHHLDGLILGLARDRADSVETTWDWYEANVSDDEFSSLTYSMDPPTPIP